ncbi:hypothetical protein AAG906_027742 [Vitis piasezkii]
MDLPLGTDDVRHGDKGSPIDVAASPSNRCIVPGVTSGFKRRRSDPTPSVHGGAWTVGSDDKFLFNPNTKRNSPLPLLRIESESQKAGVKVTLFCSSSPIWGFTERNHLWSDRRIELSVYVSGD